MLQSGLPLVAAALSDSTPTALVADALTLLTPPGRVAVLTDPEQQRLIVSGCIAVFGQRLRLVIRAGASSAGNNGQPAVTDERQRRYQAAQEHPVVKELMQRFSAELVERELVDLETWLARVAAERDQAPRRRLQGDVRSGYLAGAHETLGDG